MAEVERNSYKIFKCAKGFLLLPLEFRDVKEAKRFLDMGLEISPTSEFGNHIMALYYLKEKVCAKFASYSWNVSHPESLIAFFFNSTGLPESYTSFENRY